MVIFVKKHWRESRSKVNTIFYDADHELDTQKSCLQHILPYTEDEFILVVDDANLRNVHSSTLNL